MATPVQVTFDCADPERMAQFWVDVLGYRLPEPPDGFGTWEEWAVANRIPEDQWNAARAIEDPEGEGPRIYFQRVPEPKTAKNRVHAQHFEVIPCNLVAPDVRIRAVMT